MDIEQPLGRILSRIGKEYLAVLNSKLSNLDLDRNYYALTLIEKQDGNLTQQELADLLGTDKVSMVRIVDYLFKNGYILRVQNKNDRRQSILKLTEKAKNELPKIKNAIKEVTEKAVSGLSNDELENFLKTIQLIKNNLTHINS